MKTPTLPAETTPDRIVVIPDVERRRTSALIALTALAVAAAMLLGGGIVYTVEQARLRDRDRLVQAASVEAATARAGAGTTLADQAALQAHVAELEDVVGALQQEQHILRGQAAQAQGQVDWTQARLDDVHARLDDAQASLGAMTGPVMAGGRYIAYVLAARIPGSPPTIVIDVGRWFTDDAAQRAAIADGAVRAGEHLVQGRYLRTTDHGWRILPVQPGARFTILTNGRASGRTTVTFARFAAILASPSSADGRIAHDPFWIDVQGHRVVAGNQQLYRAP
ncbi:MAG: hypothetical protein ABJC60_03445 [Actinomycetota bacterium]